MKPLTTHADGFYTEMNSVSWLYGVSARSLAHGRCKFQSAM